MKNDFDFIKDKFDGVNAPGDMDESFVLDKLESAQPKVVEIKKVKPVKKYGLIAACALLLSAAIVGVSVFRLSKAPAFSAGEVVSDDGSSALYRFSDRSEVVNLLSRIGSAHKSQPQIRYSDGIEYEEYVELFDAASEKSFNASAASPSHGETYIQVDGVDEADVVKTDGKYIYVARYDDLTIYSAEGKDSKIVSKLKTEYSSTENEEFRELYLKDDRLIVICGIWKYYFDSTPDEAEADEETYSGVGAETRVDVYDCSDAANLKKLDSFTQSGTYSSSRMIGDKLYLVTNKNSSEDRTYPLPYVCRGSDAAAELAATDIYCVEEPSDSSFVVVSEFDTADAGAQTVTKSVLGSSGEVYCSSDNLYVTGYCGRYLGGIYLEDGAFVDYSKATAPESLEQTQIIKFSLKNGVELVSSSKVKGFIDNQYSLDESGGNLRIATTSTDKKGRDENNLFVLDGDLKTLGSVTGFAKDESIKAVRYVGDTAYVITYEETDPLFVIDLSDSAEPKILGSVKISGFSSMLVPIDDNTILGIGFHTQEEDWNEEMEIEEGLKLALFDVSDSMNPKVLDSEIFKYYYSEVQYSPKALLRNTERGCFSVPYEKSDYDDDDFEYGVITFSVRDGKISIDQQDKSDLEVERCTYVGDTIYMLNMYEDGIDCAEYK